MSDSLLDQFYRALELADAERERFLAEQERINPDVGRQLRRLLIRDEKGHAPLAGLGASRSVVSTALRAALPGLLPEGWRLGAYRICELAGTGGMGRVYRAVRCDGEVEQTVAIKLIRPDRLEPTVLARFSSERRLLASLRHPGICTFLDAGTTDDGTPFVVMEHVEGEPLLAYCDRLCLGVRERLRLLRKILAAVAHAHDRLVIHRDIKGSNVLVTEDGETKLLDFGIGKSLADADPAATATMDRFLTPHNAAPEVLLGESTGVACDIYALGVLACELLCGRPPFQFDGLRSAEIERLILLVPPTPPSQRVGDEAARARGESDAPALARRLRGELDAIVLRCLRKQPGDRYPSVRDLDDDIACYLEHRPVRAHRGDRLYRIGRFLVRNRLATGLVVALGLSLLLGSVGLLVQSLELARQRNAAMLERDHAQQVVAVLRDAFLAADPTRAAGADVRIRDVLDAARPRISALAERQPDLFLVLADTVAGVELDLRSDAQAAELALRGIEVAETVHAEPELLDRLRITSARALIGLGDRDHAQAQLDTIAEHRRDTPEWLIAQARIAFHRSEVDDAIDLLQRAIASLADRGPDDELAVDARWQLSESQRWGRRHADALDTLDAMLEWLRSGLPDDHARVLLTRLRRLNIQAEHLDPATVVDELSEVAEKVVALYGPLSTMAGDAHNALGSALRRADRLDPAIEHLRLAWAAWRHTLGDDHPNTLRLGRNLAMSLALDSRFHDEAETTLRQVLHQAEKRFGLDSPLVIAIRISLARLLGDTKRWPEALAIMATDAAARGADIANRANRRLQIEEVTRLSEGAGCERGDAADRPPNCTAVMALLQRLHQAEEFAASAETSGQ